MNGYFPPDRRPLEGIYGDSWYPPDVVASCSPWGLSLLSRAAGLAWDRLGSAWAGLAWVWLALLRICLDFFLDFGWISAGLWLRLDFGLILVWLDLDLA